jgi:hypothetical protein
MTYQKTPAALLLLFPHLAERATPLPQLSYSTSPILLWCLDSSTQNARTKIFWKHHLLITTALKISPFLLSYHLLLRFFSIPGWLLPQGLCTCSFLLLPAPHLPLAVCAQSEILLKRFFLRPFSSTTTATPNCCSPEFHSPGV